MAAAQSRPPSHPSLVIEANFRQQCWARWVPSLQTGLWVTVIVAGGLLAGVYALTTIQQGHLIAHTEQTRDLVENNARLERQLHEKRSLSYLHDRLAQTVELAPATDKLQIRVPERTLNLSARSSLQLRRPVHLEHLYGY